MDELDEEINTCITEKLIDYYTLCIHTLHKVSCESEKGLDQQLAQDTFERLYSLYLFKTETDLLYEIIDQLAISINQNTNLTDIERINSNLWLTRYVLGMISDEGILAIHRSPGIVHRVNLIKYIIKTNLSVDKLQALYPYLEFASIDTMKRNEQILQKINIINQNYLVVEKNCIYCWFRGKEELSKKDIKCKYQLNKSYDD